MKEKLVKLDFIKTKNFHTIKDTANRIKRQATDWKNIFAKNITDKGFLSKIYNEHLKPTIRNNLTMGKKS